MNKMKIAYLKDFIFSGRNFNQLDSKLNVEKKFKQATRQGVVPGLQVVMPTQIAQGGHLAY